MREKRRLSRIRAYWRYGSARESHAARRAKLLAIVDFVREGGNHEICTLAGERLVIPRHREVNERTAEGIIRKAEEVTTIASDINLREVR